MDIKKDDLQGAQIKALLQEHLDHMQSSSPPESTHALDLPALRAPEITFWCAWDNGNLLGCGALKELSSTCGEIKSMRTAANQLRRGVASRILQQIIAEAKKRSYKQLSLETGSMEVFASARKLYMKFGFVECEPFADYIEDPNSIFLTLRL